MTINKSQGQILNKVGLHLPSPVFSHGQLYIALSHVTSHRSLKILIKNEHAEYEDYTKNIVHKEIFLDLSSGTFMPLDNVLYSCVITYIQHYSIIFIKFYILIYQHLICLSKLIADMEYNVLSDLSLERKK